MKTFMLYHFKFWRYLIVSVVMILGIISGAIYLAGENYINFDDWNGLYLFVIIGFAMFFGLITGAKVSTYRYDIELNKLGLNLKIKSPFIFVSDRSQIISWDDIDSYNLEDYENGSTVNFSVISTGLKYSFTNSIFNKSYDLFPFYEALQKGAEAFNEEHLTDQKKIGIMPGFYAGKFAFGVAIFLGILMVAIPVIILITSNQGAGYFQYFKLIWFYLLSGMIIRKVYVAQKQNH